MFLTFIALYTCKSLLRLQTSPSTRILESLKIWVIVTKNVLSVSLTEYGEREVGIHSQEFLHRVNAGCVRGCTSRPRPHSSSRTETTHRVSNKFSTRRKVLLCAIECTFKRRCNSDLATLMFVTLMLLEPDRKIRK